MKTDTLTTKECLYLVYTYVSISAFLMMVINKIAGNFEKNLDFNPIVSIAIVLNLVILVSIFFYKKNIAHK
jgi:hypothetical protein